MGAEDSGPAFACGFDVRAIHELAPKGKQDRAAIAPDVSAAVTRGGSVELHVDDAG